MQELRAYKSLEFEGYKHLMVGSLTSKFLLFHHLVTSSWSQQRSSTLSVPPVKVWVAAKMDGMVICAHCDCMAGLCEACSRIAAILFTLDANVQARKCLTCNSMPCSWLPPPPHSRVFCLHPSQILPSQTYCEVY